MKKNVKFDYYLLEPANLDLNFKFGGTVTVKVKKITFHLQDIEDYRVLEMNNQVITLYPAKGNITFTEYKY